MFAHKLKSCLDLLGNRYMDGYKILLIVKCFKYLIIIFIYLSCYHSENDFHLHGIVLAYLCIQSRHDDPETQLKVSSSTIVNPDMTFRQTC